MFDRQELQKAIDQQQRSFALLRWVNQQLRQKKLDFSVVHENLSFAEAAQEWLSRCYHSLPESSRPSREEIPEFASLFASYLKTSFEPMPATRQLDSGCGCFCSYCSYLVNVAAHLKPRKLGKKSRPRARELKQVYLEELAREAGLSLNGAQAGEFIDQQANLATRMAQAAYARELVRRTQFASQGEGVYALWREFAWESGTIKRGFRLKVEEIIQAEQEILECLKGRVSAR